MVLTKVQRENRCEKGNIFLKLYEQVPIGWVEARLKDDDKLYILREFNQHEIINSDNINKRFRRLLKSNKHNKKLQKLLEKKLANNEWESYSIEPIYKLTSREYMNTDLKTLFNELETIYNCKEYVNDFFYYDYFGKDELEANHYRLECIAKKYHIVIKEFDKKEYIEILYDIFLENHELVEKELKDLIFKNIKYKTNTCFNNSDYLENVKLRKEIEQLKKENENYKKLKDIVKDLQKD